MEVVIDSHALFWYASQNTLIRKRLSKRANQVLNSSNKIYVPTIVLLETHYIFRKYLQEKKFYRLLKRINKDRRFVVVSLDLEILEYSLKVKLDEIHDRIIVGTARFLAKPLISRDLVIREVYRRTIW